MYQPPGGVPTQQQQQVWTGFGFSSRPVAPARLPSVLPSAAAPTDVTGNPSGGAAVASAAVPAVLPSAVVQSAAAGPVAGQPLFCDACEKEFTHDRGLQQHLKSHVQCDQCSFTAIPKVVNEHKAMAHAVARNWGYDAADIQKWREARRKNYPSGSNVEKRRAEDQSKEDRGQIASDPMFKVGHQNKRRRKAPPATAASAPAPAPASTPASTPAAAAKPSAATKPAGGLSSLAMYSSSESDSETPAAAAPAATAPLASSAAAAAAAAVAPALLEVPEGARPAKQPKPTNPPDGQHNHNNKAAARPDDDGMVDPTKVLRPKRYGTTLLERLLAKEVKHERNVVLQCIRHIVRQKYFGLG